LSLQSVLSARTIGHMAGSRADGAVTQAVDEYAARAQPAKSEFPRMLRDRRYDPRQPP
jgi:hypothetical protein